MKTLSKLKSTDLFRLTIALAVIFFIIGLSHVRAQSKTKDNVNEIKKLIIGNVEVDGHLMDSVKFYLVVNLDGFAIKGSNGKAYKKRMCDKKECIIIHLHLNNNHFPYYSNGITLTPNFSHTN